MSRQVIVTGFIKTVSPLHITAPSNARYDLEKLSKVYGDAKSCPGSIPCTSIQTMAIPELFTKENEAGEKTVSHGLKDYPVIAANNLAGRIRRKIANVYLKALRENGQQVNLGAYSAITCGAVTGSPDGTPVSYEDYKKAVDHPSLGLLGGGPRMILRKAKIFNSIALTHETTELLNRNRIPYEAIYDERWDRILASHALKRPSYGLTKIWCYRRNDDLMTLADISQAEESIENFDTEFANRQGQIIEEFQHKPEEGGKTKLFTFQALEFVVPGVSFPFVAVLENPTGAQVGLWIRGFEQFCKTEMMGGWSRNGFGQFYFDDGCVTVVEDGELSSEPFAPCKTDSIYPSSGFCNDAVNAWFDAAETVTAAEINDLLKLPVEKAEKKEKKSKK